MISLPSVVEHMIQKNQCLFTSTQCKVCCAMLISESQKLSHYQVGLFYHSHELIFCSSAKPSPLLSCTANAGSSRCFLHA